MNIDKPLVFVVDDDIDYLNSSVILFPKYDVKVAATPESAMALIHDQKRPAVLFLDINLGARLSGIQLHSKMRANARHALITVYVSGDGSPETQVKALQAGDAIAYYVKPVHPDVMRCIVEQGGKAQIQLAQRATLDPLTGLYNRVGFYELANQEFRRAYRESSEIGCIFIDVDQLKPINDNEGHEVGDEAIKKIANALNEKKTVMRDLDVVARWGGDEFVALLPHANLDQAERIAVRIESYISKLEVMGKKGNRIPLSVSTGCTSISHGRIGIDFVKTVDYLVKVSDAKMQERKLSKRCAR